MNKMKVNAIEHARQKMIESIRKYGQGNKTTISLSQELDRLIVEYQKSTNIKSST